MVRKGGLEPPRYCYRQPLKLVRLPIPPLPRSGLATAQSGLKTRLYIFESRALRHSKHSPIGTRHLRHPWHLCRYGVFGGVAGGVAGAGAGVVVAAGAGVVDAGAAAGAATGAGANPPTTDPGPR